MPAKVLLIDNFDSFTYNLVQVFQTLGLEVNVFRNDAITQEQAKKIDPQFLVISPGPGTPNDSGISKTLMNSFLGKIPILGVCLGHQCLAELFGGKVIKAKKPMHGKLSSISHEGTGIFSNMPQHFLATRYHSLIVDRQSLPSCLKMTAQTEDGEIMGLSHVNYNIHGVQFHPESIQTTGGVQLLKNFIEVCV